MKAEVLWSKVDSGLLNIDLMAKYQIWALRSKRGLVCDLMQVFALPVFRVQHLSKYADSFGRDAQTADVN